MKRDKLSLLFLLLVLTIVVMVYILTNNYRLRYDIQDDQIRQAVKRYFESRASQNEVFEKSRLSLIDRYSVISQPSNYRGKINEDIKKSMKKQQPSNEQEHKKETKKVESHKEMTTIPQLPEKETRLQETLAPKELPKVLPQQTASPKELPTLLPQALLPGDGNPTPKTYNIIPFFSHLQPVAIFDKVQNLCSDEKISQASQKVISLCIFGKDSWKSYRENLENLAGDTQTLKFYNDWSIFLFHQGKYLDAKLKADLRAKIGNLFFCDIEKIPGLEWFHEKNARMWRFLPVADDNIDVSCFRDLDSPILPRDADAVTEWMSTDKLFHMMRDHNQHKSHVMAGMWCFRNSKNRTLGKQLVENVIRYSLNRTEEHEARKDNDQVVMTHHFYPFVQLDSLEHDSFWCQYFDNGSGNTRPFPSRRDPVGWYIGGSRFERPLFKMICPPECRPKDHQDWDSC